ncbi:uncharacterized protein CTHT_0004380 [Thermochaetoides thermophila DSM 1495]|uniref:Uncharacterized protein n=1 Tax=Chaetomium thermophilum (strain DSM 1495 / CBS 144.50 / IMI 039719) TaxID=759272 RepID=G0RZV8_CHATD|nr:hypothetical protein CTHT_0004380 [Thermochaetoides thermophila DSM 1495]EGS23736.1 hypothetical protein CTHT_0004380 [Thermochaetoides thermophila DSM 1495]
MDKRKGAPTVKRAFTSQPQSFRQRMRRQQCDESSDQTAADTQATRRSIGWEEDRRDAFRRVRSRAGKPVNGVVFGRCKRDDEVLTSRMRLCTPKIWGKRPSSGGWGRGRFTHLELAFWGGLVSHLTHPTRAAAKHSSTASSTDTAGRGSLLVPLDYH